MQDLSREEQLETLVAEHFPVLRLSGVGMLTPDASTRTYYRLFFQNQTPASMVAMCFDSLVSPEYEGVNAIEVDEAYVLLSHFLKAHAIPVPELLLDARTQGVLLLEDVGDRLLAPMLCSGESREIALKGYTQAVATLQKLQAIPADPGCLAFQRSFSETAYINEMNEYLDFILTPAACSSAESESFQRACCEIASELGSLKKTLVHRDYHGWNLLLDEHGKLRVIDFQDALLAPAAYDLVALLHDRDVDTLLGKEAYLELLRSYPASSDDRGRFLAEFSIVALQRDLKVAGRFAKLSAAGLERYGDWIVGTQRRIGRTLEYLIGVCKKDSLKELASVLASRSEPLAAGLEEGAWYR